MVVISARTWVLKSHGAFVQLVDGNGRADTLPDLARNCLATGDYAAAGHYAEQAGDLARAYGNYQREGLILSELGKAKTASGDIAKRSEPFSRRNLSRWMRPAGSYAAVSLTSCFVGFRGWAG